jgi:hypothetical protein
MLALTPFLLLKAESPVQVGCNSDDSIVRLGSSRYYLRLSNDLTISEAKGKEGQLGYNIIPKDTASHLFGFIQIKRGNPVGGPSRSFDPKEYINANLLGKEIIWMVEEPGPGYFFGRMSQDKISAWISSNDRNGLERLIKLFSTLTRK